jgi:hypothetical protein
MIYMFGRRLSQPAYIRESARLEGASFHPILPDGTTPRSASPQVV